MLRFGNDLAAASKGRVQPVDWSVDDLINPHMLIIGDTGTGKTHTLRRLITALAMNGGTRIHVFDPHGDIETPAMDTTVFHETSPYGINPLDLNPHHETGGVRRAISTFVDMLNATSLRIGPKQEAVLRRLLLELYLTWGMHPDRPSTWGPRQSTPLQGPVPEAIFIDVPAQERDLALEAGAILDEDSGRLYCLEHTVRLRRWPATLQSGGYPTLRHLLNLAEARLQAVYLGTGSRAVEALQAVNRKARKVFSLHRESLKQNLDLKDETQRPKELVEAADAASEAYQAYLHTIVTGAELGQALRYDSADTLRSTIDRIRNLAAIGCFRDVPPPLDPSSRVWRYQIRALGAAEKRMFVETCLERLFIYAQQRGEQSRLRDVVVIDELPIFVSEDPDHVINRMIREMRKFGLGVIMAAQNPQGISEDIISGVGTRVVLGLDQYFWAMGSKKLGIDQRALQSIKPRQTALVYLKRIGQLNSQYQSVQLDGAAQATRQRQRA